MPMDSLLKRLALLGTPRESVISTPQEPLPQVPPEYRHWVSIPVEPPPPPPMPFPLSPRGYAVSVRDPSEDVHEHQRQQLRLHHLHPAARETEFSHVRWTDINWGASEFTRQRYTLRAYSFTRPRPTALVVSLAVSDGHTAAQVGAAVEAIARNLRFLEQRGTTSRRQKARWDFDFDEEGGGAAAVGGQRPSWKNVVFVMVGSSDTMRPEVVEYLMRLRLFTPGLMPHRGVMGETYELAVRLRPETGLSAEEEERAAWRRRERRRRQSMSAAPGGRGAPAASSSSSSSSVNTTTTTPSSRRAVSVFDDYGDAVGEAPPQPQPVQMLFFDSRARLRTAEDANMWVVRAFADCLKADAWMPLDHLLGLGPFLGRQWAPLYSLGDGAVAAVLRDMAEHPECAVVFSRRLGQDVKGGEGMGEARPPAPPLPGGGELAGDVLGMLAVCRQGSEAGAGSGAARPGSSRLATLTATGINRPGSPDGRRGGGMFGRSGSRPPPSGGRAVYRPKETSRELGDGVLAYRLIHD